MSYFTYELINMKREPEYSEGPEAHSRFVSAMRSILGVSREEIVRREAAYKKQAALNPHKRGPKPKKTLKSVSRVLDDQTLS
jgi:hypothetical protein